MTGMTSEMLSSYHDRELAPGAAAPLRELLAEDAEARRLLQDFERVDEAVKAAFDADLDVPVPLALARTVRSGFAARRRRAVARAALRWAGPIAASIAVVLLGHQASMREAELALEAREAQIAALADRAVQDALESALSGARIAMSDPEVAGTVSVTPVRTYRSASNHWCREFVEEFLLDARTVTRFGVACREKDGGWSRVETKQPGNMPPPVSTTL
ncbi:MAG TPA: hypothetical protein VLA52_05735 [Thermohalobaculum sp.]|nr:hypothetical protein [Thermohalobaculum sp.]